MYNNRLYLPPVSYTHLDVYKRQEYQIDATNTRRKICVLQYKPLTESSRPIQKIQYFYYNLVIYYDRSCDYFFFKGNSCLRI